MNISELRNKSIEELLIDLEELRRNQFNLRMQKASGHLLRNVRRDIARVKTVINEKRNKV